MTPQPFAALLIVLWMTGARGLSVHRVFQKEKLSDNKQEVAESSFKMLVVAVTAPLS
jgi:hypothetical protein